MAAITLEILRCLVILAFAQAIAMPLRGLNAEIRQHVSPGWTGAVAQPQR